MPAYSVHLTFTAVISSVRSSFALIIIRLLVSFFFFFNDTATTEIYTLSLHDALPIFLASLTGMRAMRSFERHLAVPLALLIMPLSRAATQGWIEPIRPLPRGAIEKVRSAVQVAVTGRVARVTVEEWFRNGGMLLDEASYLYPLPGESVFSDFSLWQGDRELKGEPMDAAQARAIYEDIVRRKRDPALIELAGHGLLRARVFPIAPGETRKITLRYTQLLDRVGDAWRVRDTARPGAA